MRVNGLMPMNVSSFKNRIIVVVSVLQTQASAIRMLQARIETIKDYLIDVQQGYPRIKKMN